MFKLERRGFFRSAFRLTSKGLLTPDDFRKVATRVGREPIRARKIGRVAARRTEVQTRIETRWNGKESENVAEPGDWIVTSLAPDGAVLRDNEGQVNTYVIKPEKFSELYEPITGTTEFGDSFRAKGIVEALLLSGGFELKAPWGEIQKANSGYLVLNGNEVYGNNREVFDTTYVPVARIL
jgi:hypothetical protein